MPKPILLPSWPITSWKRLYNSLEFLHIKIRMTDTERNVKWEQQRWHCDDNFILIQEKWTLKNTGEQLQSCLLAIVMKRCRIWPCRWLATQYLPLWLYWVWKMKKKKTNKTFSSRICLICSYHLARSLGGESGHGAIDHGLLIYTSGGFIVLQFC